MLVEKKFSEALKDFDKGRKVLVLSTLADGTISCDKLEELWPEETHFLVDVPAYETPEFKSTINNMIHSKEEMKDEKSKDEEPAPPLTTAGR